jgi:hypothetical protein
MLHKYCNHGQIKENELVEHVTHIRGTDSTKNSLTEKNSRKDIFEALRVDGTMVSKYTLKMQGRKVLVVWFRLSHDKDQPSALAT